MIELGEFARDGRLRGLLRQEWLQPYNGVEGVALSYDDRLIDAANFIVSSRLGSELRGTIGHSRYVALLLAAVARRTEDSKSDRDTLLDYLSEGLFQWWRELESTGRLHYVSPIVVEVATREDFGREVGFEPTASDYPYRYRIRPSRGARLHVASAGGRIDTYPPTHTRSYGTLGGFIIDNVSNATFGVTAEHVCLRKTGHARPLPIPHAPALVRNNVSLLLGRLGLERYRNEECPWHWGSPASVIPKLSCTAQATPQTAGIDVALHTVSPQPGLRAVRIAELADLSPVLELSFIGATSGYQRARVTSYSVWHNYELDDNDVCIHDCVQIKLADRPYVRTDISQGGDSGAWLLAQGRDDLYWVGLLTGGDGDVAGIVPARRIVENIERDLKFSVQAMV
ncbi:hypothetical protein ACCC98_30295 [Rhizobium pisi]|uniref:hypothetical protein n=1 Tax=Rhizobium pisi TaxID=574561 RepID=UPI0039B07099